MHRTAGPGLKKSDPFEVVHGLEFAELERAQVDNRNTCQKLI